jgi:hypothetical protein
MEYVSHSSVPQRPPAPGEGWVSRMRRTPPQGCSDQEQQRFRMITPI